METRAGFEKELGDATKSFKKQLNRRQKKIVLRVSKMIQADDVLNLAKQYVRYE